MPRELQSDHDDVTPVRQPDEISVPLRQPRPPGTPRRPPVPDAAPVPLENAHAQPLPRLSLVVQDGVLGANAAFRLDGKGSIAALAALAATAVIGFGL